jgi:hypothetical protein
MQSNMSGPCGRSMAWFPQIMVMCCPRTGVGLDGACLMGIGYLIGQLAADARGRYLHATVAPVCCRGDYQDQVSGKINFRMACFIPLNCQERQRIVSLEYSQEHTKNDSILGFFRRITNTCIALPAPVLRLECITTSA